MDGLRPQTVRERAVKCSTMTGHRHQTMNSLATRRHVDGRIPRPLSGYNAPRSIVHYTNSMLRCQS